MNLFNKINYKLKKLKEEEKKVKRRLNKKIIKMRLYKIKIKGRILDVKEDKTDRMDYSKTIYVENLSCITNEEALKKFFVDFWQN